jgi:DNA-binding NarL/FixJ family response regulator
VAMIEGLAIVAVHRRAPLRALRLYAAAAALRRSERLQWTASEQRKLEEAMASARAAISPAAARTAEQAGQRLNPEQAITYALDDVWIEPVQRNAAIVVLTRRERHVAGLVADGLTNREIAGRLAISERTVEAHLQHIRTKLDLRSRAQVAGWAVEHAVSAPR